jgi:hypothetical protein
MVGEGESDLEQTLSSFCQDIDAKPVHKKYKSHFLMGLNMQNRYSSD